MTKYFEISIELTEILSIDEIWPDGNAPENPTVEDVRREFMRHRDVLRNAEDWGLTDGATAYIREIKREPAYALLKALGRARESGQ